MVIHNGREIDRFNDRREADELRNQLGIPSSATVVGTVGRYVESKGHLELIKAWASMEPEPEDLVLVLVGYGPERERLDAYSKSVDVGDSVILTGRRNDIPDLLSLMDLFVFPSHHEGFSGALLEAMGAGLGIVATPVGGNTDMIIDGETGLLVPVRDSDAIQRAIELLVDDQDTRRALGSSASHKAMEEFSLETMTNSFEKLYDEVSA
jgi:glycosyltransferase involved in cell wall biosynthesis